VVSGIEAALFSNSHQIYLREHDHSGHAIRLHGLNSSGPCLAFPLVENQFDTRVVPASQWGVLHHPAQTYGQSVLGHSLEFYGPSDGPVDLLILAAMHGDELEAMVLLSEALRQIQPGAVRNPVILAANPDGILRGTRGNVNGVDLNRNWPAGNWSPNTVYHKPHAGLPADIELSPGREAGSEPETKALLTLLDKMQPKAIISLHSALGCIDDPDNSGLSHWIGKEVGLEVVADVGYPTPGSFGSWARERGQLIVTWELLAASLPELRGTYLPTLRRLICGDLEPGIL